MPDEMKSIGEAHKDLIAQAEANAKANADAHAKQMEENQKFQELQAKAKQVEKPAEAAPQE